MNMVNMINSDFLKSILVFDKVNNLHFTTETSVLYNSTLYS